MTRPRIYKNEQIIAALRETKGLVYLAAKRLGCDPGTIYDRAKRSPQVAKCIANQRGEIVDTAELTLYNGILAAESWAVLFALRTLGKDRGYVERVEQDLRGDVRQRVTEEVSDAPDSGKADKAAPGAAAVPPK